MIAEAVRKGTMGIIAIVMRILALDASQGTAQLQIVDH